VTEGARQQHRGVGGISHRTASWLAWSLWALCAALIALALLLDFVTTHQSPSFLPGGTLSPSLAVLAGLLSMAYPTIGALIASRLPTNLIGWLFCGVGLIYAVRRLTVAYADYVLNENIALPWGQYVAWFSLLVWFAVLILVGAFLMLLFPDGRLPSRRWRIVAWAAVFGAALTTLADALRPGPLPTHPYIDNPFGVWITVGGFTTSNLYAALSLLGMTLLTASTLAALFSLILRLHRARRDQRQQLKWFLYAVVPSVVFLDLLLVHVMLDTLTTYFVLGTVFLLSWVAIEISVIVAVSALLIVPVFTYIAILRYRLYDIDVVINRTLVYGTLTVLLALVYFGGIVVLQRLFVALTGQMSTLAVVASTLVIAALFNPLRHRIQAFVDRRFYRSKYDARKTLEAFSAKLRDETDLDALNEDLVEVVRETMQPAHVSL
jgi:hypothetical protein